MRDERASLFDDLQGAPLVEPHDGSLTRFAPFVEIGPDTREGALELAEAAWEWVEQMTENGVADDTRLVRAVTVFFA